MREFPPNLQYALTEEPQQTNYQLLVGHRRTDGSMKMGEQLRTEYITRTDELIRQMTEGVLVKDPETQEQSYEKPDAVIWLDKSARPVAWLTKEMWQRYAPSPGEPAPEMPGFNFVNIDRLQWVNTVDPNGTGNVDISRVDPSVVRSLRSIFVKPEHKREGLTQAIDTAPAALDRKTILIVDEVRSTGRTLDIATKFFHEAFPTARIASTHWMGGVAMKDGAVGNADLPVWYKETSATGRGVGNRDEALSQNSRSITQKLGGLFLSTPFRQPDPSSIQLRLELQQLAHDPDVLVVPSLLREEDDFEKRAAELNGTDFLGFIERKRDLGKR